MIRIRLMHEGKVVKQITSRLHEGIVLEQIARFKEQYDTVQILEGNLSEDAKSMLHHVAKKIVPAAMAAGMAMSGAHAQQGGANPNYPGMDRSIGQHISDIVSPDYKEKMRQRDYEKDTQRQEWNAKQNEIRRQRIEASRSSVSNTPGVQKNVTVYDQARPSADGKFYVIYGMDDRVTRIPVVGTEFMAADSQRLAHYIAPNGQVYYVRHSHNSEPKKENSTTLFNGVTESELGEDQVNELSRGTLKSYSKAASQEVHGDQRDAGGARDHAAHNMKHGDVKQSAAWSDEAEWLDKRAEKRAGGVAKATTKIAQKKDVSEGVAETLPLNDALKLLRQYGADNFKTTSNELHFYKDGKPFSVDLAMNPDATRSASLSSLNSATRGLKGVSVGEGYTVTRGIDKERYTERPGLEGPFSAKNGKVVYYDKVEGKYYDPETDFYLGNDDWTAMNEGDPNAKVGTIPSSGTVAPTSMSTPTKFAPTGKSTPAKFNAQGQLELDPLHPLDAAAQDELKKAGVQVAEGTNTLESILSQYSADYAKFKAGGDIDENQDFFDALYEYYQDEMPYGVQKARDGDPYEWITQRLDQEAGMEPVAEAAPALVRGAAGLVAGGVAAAGTPAMMAILGPILGIGVGAVGAYNASKMAMAGVDQLWDWAAEKLGGDDNAEQFAMAHLTAANKGLPQFEYRGKTYDVKVPQNQARAGAVEVRKMTESLTERRSQGMAEGYPTHQDLSGISIDKLKAYLAKQSQQQVSGEGNQVKRVRAELQRREQGVAEADNIDAELEATPGEQASADQNIVMQIRKASDYEKPTAITLADGTEITITQQTANKILTQFNKLMPQSKELMQSTLNTEGGFNQLLDYFGETAVANEVYMEASARARSIIQSVFGK